MRRTTKKLISGLKNLFRHINYFNNMENTALTVEFIDNVKKIKERNSKIVFDTYYLPEATSAILREDDYLTTPQIAKSRAAVMMLYDLSTGELDEFYRFKND